MHSGTYHDAVGMVTFVVFEFFSGTKTRWTEIHAIPVFAHWVCTFYADGMGEVARAAVAVELQTRLIYG